jgi:hypothetical protein
MLFGLMTLLACAPKPASGSVAVVDVAPVTVKVFPIEAPDAGSAWTCVTGGWADDGESFHQWESERDFCLEARAAATAYTHEWAQACEDALVESGFADYDCYASCTDSWDPCATSE